MTCVVGLQHDGITYLGGDSAAAAGTSMTPYGLPKVFTRNGYALGYAGSFRAGQVLQHHVDLPAVPRLRGKHLDAFVITQVVPAIRDAYIEHAMSDAGPTPMPGWPVLLGVAGVLYSMDFDWAAHRSRNDYMAIGTGEDLALGALHATRNTNLTPARRVRLALNAAAHHSTTVRKPFKIVTG